MNVGLCNFVCKYNSIFYHLTFRNIHLTDVVVFEFVDNLIQAESIDGIVI